MYERNAIVLERYFYEIFNFKSSSNLKENYYNYRKLFDCYGILNMAKEKEEVCRNEFELASKEIEELQKTHEKLYNRSAKFEYSRYIIFCNTEEPSETIEKHLNRVEEDAQRNIDDLKELGEKFVQAISDFNQKDRDLKLAIEEREKAQKEYNEIFEKSQICYEELSEELLEKTRQFIESDNKENKKELQEIFEDNGKNERNQFDPDVISNTINKSIEIYKTEMDIYLAGQDRISKLFEEIQSDSVKNDKHTKYYKDSKAKLDFLNSEKEYIVQFLDNERMGAIYDKKAHRKLMLEACKKFSLDFEQIDKLYDIIIKEAAGRSTKKIYKEGYNKEYLLDLEDVGAEPTLDTGKMRQEAIAFVNLNYWRVEGMKRVYEVFEDVVTTTYERDLTEFLPEEPVPEVVEEIVEEPAPEVVEEIIEEPTPEVIEKIVEEPVQEAVQEVEEAPEVIEDIAEEEQVPEVIEEIAEEEQAPEVIEEIAEEEQAPEVIEEIAEEEQAPEVIEEIAEEEQSELEEDIEEKTEIIEEAEEIEKIEEPEIEEVTKPQVLFRSSKIALANAIYYSLQTREFAHNEDETQEEEPEIIEEDLPEKDYSIPEKAQEILKAIDEEEEKYSIPPRAQAILEKLEKEEQEKAEIADEVVVEKIEPKEEIKEYEIIEEAEKIEEPEIVEEVEKIEKPEIIEKDEEIEATEIAEEKGPALFEKQEDDEDNTFDLSRLDDIEGEDDLEEEIDVNTDEDMEYEEDEDVEDDSILEIYFSDSKDSEKEDTKETAKNGLNKKVGLFQKLVGFNSKKKNEEA